jgi:ubiquinone/menaquinone biosynthesis C-methylase UbiE
MARAPAALAAWWDKQAPTYDRRTAGIERRWFAPGRERLCSAARGTTLELAVGTGANLPYYPSDVELTGIDWSAAMVDTARRRADSLGRHVTLQQADALSLPFDDEQFDTVLSTFSMCCIPDEKAALVEALRVLRPGGRLLLLDHVTSTTWPVRLLQHAAELVTVPLQNEHFTRRPLVPLQRLGVTVEETERRSLGLLERVHALKPTTDGAP